MIRDTVLSFTRYKCFTADEQFLFWTFFAEQCSYSFFIKDRLV